MLKLRIYAKTVQSPSPARPGKGSEPQQAGEAVRPLQRPLIRAARRADRKTAETGKPTVIVLHPDEEEAAASSKGRSNETPQQKDDSS